MKRTIVVIFLVLMSSLSQAQNQDLGDLGNITIRALAKMAEVVPPKSIVLVHCHSTQAPVLADEMNAALEMLMLDVLKEQLNYRLVSRGSALALLNKELDYQLTGNVSDATMLGIGKQLGAQYLLFVEIIGTLTSDYNLRTMYNFKTVSIKTSEMLSAYSGFIIYDLSTDEKRYLRGR